MLGMMPFYLRFNVFIDVTLIENLTIKILLIIKILQRLIVCD